MVKRIIRIIGYLILFLANLTLLWFFHSFLNLAIMVVMVEAPEHFCKMQERNVTILNESVHLF